MAVLGEQLFSLRRSSRDPTAQGSSRYGRVGCGTAHGSTCILLLVVLLVTGLFGMGVCRAQSAGAAENAIKAAFLYKFSAYIQWPPGVFSGPDAPIVFGILDADEIAENLEQITGERTVNGHPIAVRKLRPGDSISGVHVLFIGSSQAGVTENMLVESANRPVLTVTDSNHWNTSYSAINFVVVGDKVRFDVSLKSATRNDLKISTRLLSVARRVIADS